ncbi:ShlB/FhaC/HecB family hemolysin secretion/activation protein [Mannheimia massilioguelmaensis]|uniref:ShlB/FhaC/HecB family hemolysin secretion/activation protein n=1 Tax=Mannheimia massilioguelmaensis TaxID=1604354 RepID=UPI0005C85E11|nr:ShlB/FhaC/HecB family hemolysin secretion/activation protein [Mannheimia massilioguelmaensis]
MQLTKLFHYSLITSAIFFATQSLANVPDAGSLNRELEQSENQNKIKPSGELFNQSVKMQHTSQDEKGLEFQLNKIIFINYNNQQSEESEVDSIVSHYVGKMVSLSDLNKLTNEISEYYRANNYLVAKAILPPQEVKGGIVKILLLKGNIGEISLQNNSALKPSLAARIANTTIQSSEFILKDQLEKFALTMNDIPGLDSHLALSAGNKTGEANLQISLNDANRFSGYISADNQGNKTTGRYRLATGIKANNLAGLGDEFKLDLLSSNNANLKNARLEYSALIDGYATRLGVTGSYLNYKLGGNFKDLQSKGHSNSLGAYILHPTIRMPDFRLNTKISFNHQNLSDKQQAVAVLQKRKLNTVTAAINGSWNSVSNGTTYFSLSALFGNLANQTNEKSHYVSEDFKPKSHFTVYNYSLSHEQMLPKSFAFNLGISGQLADRTLDSSQKMLLGGLYGVRGYQAGIASVDQGHLVQTEIRHYLPVFQESVLTSSIFYDYGWGKYYKNTAFLAKDFDNKVKLQSIGIGFSLSAAGNYSINVVAAKPLGKKVENADKDQFWLSVIKTF